MASLQQGRLSDRVWWLLLFALVGGFVVGLPKEFGIRANPIEQKPVVQRAFACKPSAAHGKGDPCRIAIPSIHVDAKVIRLGLNPDGTLEVPTDFSLTGWWAGGTQPGEAGPAVVVGHIDSKSGPAVFYRLRKLKPGAMVKIWRAGESMVRYRVTGMTEVPKNDFPSKRVYGDLSYPGLRLVTCGGAFNSAIGHYVDNIIVFGRVAR
jgi:sortase family protein